LHDANEEKKAAALAQTKAKHLERAVGDLRLSMRAVFLMEPAPDILPGRAAPPAVPQPSEQVATRDEILTVFSRYQLLVERDRKLPQRIDSPRSDDGGDSLATASDSELYTGELSTTQLPEQRYSSTSLSTQDGKTDDEQLEHLPVALPRISWQCLLGWLEQERDLARKADFKRSCSALLRSVMAWRSFSALPKEKMHGVHLFRFFEWMWPFGNSASMADLFRTLGLHEINKLRQSTPRLIDFDERRQLERVFKSLDSQGRGCCSPQDLAGGTISDSQQAAVRLVDAQTVQEVFGVSEISLNLFLEFMSEDRRGHENHEKVPVGSSGQRLLKTNRDVLGFEGWLYEEELDEADKKQRRLIDALETEVLKWEEKAKHETLHKAAAAKTMSRKGHYRLTCIT